MINVTFRYWYVRGTFGKLVGWYTSSEFSHVSTIIDNTEIEAVIGKGVIEHIPKKHFHGETFTFQIEDNEHNRKAIEWLRYQVGKEYDLIGTLKFALPFIEDSAKSYYCSKIQSRFAAMVGIYPKLRETTLFSPQISFMMCAQKKHDEKSLRNESKYV
jgi:uncharacterized protein YycO